jgi:homoserine dehydrogenase
MSSLPVLPLGLCGFGTVGQGVWQHLEANRALLRARLGVELRVTRVAVRDARRKRDVRLPRGVLGTDPLAIARDPAVPVVCELMGGTGLAREVTLAALRLGKVVVSANKALICEHGS